MALCKVKLENRLLQRISPPGEGLRIEGIAFSSDGNLIGTVLSEGNQACLYQRQKDSHNFENEPFCILGDGNIVLDYPHDIAFSPDSESEFLAVALRPGPVVFFQKIPGELEYNAEPVQVLQGPEVALNYSDGVAFAPPVGDVVAVCDLAGDKINFYQFNRDSTLPVNPVRPAYTITGAHINQPDGIAFSRCGRFLACTNHNENSITVFERSATDSKNRYVFRQKIVDETLIFPHSVQFSPEHAHLLVTCAGANYINVYHRTSKHEHKHDMELWSESADQQLLAGSKQAFNCSNSTNKMEGGPKGITMSKDFVAFCRPETGIEIYPYEECRQYMDFVLAGESRIETVLKPNPELQLVQSEEGIELTSIARGETHKLNPSSALIWMLCDGQSNLSDILGNVRAIYPDVEHIDSEVVETIRTLFLSNLLEHVS